MKTTLAMIVILVVITSMTVYLDRYYLAGSSSIDSSNFTTNSVDIRSDVIRKIAPPFENFETLNETLLSGNFKKDDPQSSHDKRNVEIDASQFSGLTKGDWITLPLTYGSITLQVKSNKQKAGHQTLTLSDVDTGLNSVITLTEESIFGTLTTTSGNHQLTAFKPIENSSNQPLLYGGTIQEERPEHELFSQLRESDELFPNAEDLLNETEHRIHKEHIHHHENFHPLHEH